MEHAVLGKRWGYDGPADPVYITVMTEAVIMGMPQAEQFHEVDGHQS